MREVEIRLVIDKVTRKKNIIIHYESEADALPMEHEEEHRKLVQSIVQSLGIDGDELGEVIVEREGATHTPEAEEEAEPMREAQRVKS